MPKRRKAKPRTTLVPDRSTWPMPLGSEAAMLARFLRNVGADGARAVLPGSSGKERKDWMESRSRFAKRLPMWMLDLAVAILEQIPIREDRPQGRRREDATARVELLSAGGNTTKAAKLVAELEAAREAAASGKRPSDDAVAARAEALARRVYRQRRRNVPKSK
jgi:hypothetical protein